MLKTVFDYILDSIKETNCCAYSFIHTVLFNSAKIDGNDLRLVNLKPLFLKFKKVIENFLPNIFIILENEDIVIKNINFHLLNNEFNLENDKLPSSSLGNDCCLITQIKTNLLLNGDLIYNDKFEENSKGYLLEFYFKTEDKRLNFENILSKINIYLKKRERFGLFYLYSSGAEDIYDILVKIGLSKIALDIENNLIIRQTKNDTNRKFNCMKSNIQKSVNSSIKQLEAIDTIKDLPEFELLDEDSKEIALLRLSNPNATLRELCQLHSKKISPAGIKYKLDKIINLYKNIK